MKLDYQVPAFHALATEDPEMRWDYFVQHYDDAAQAGQQVLRDRGRRALSSRGYPRRLHRAQRDDHRLPARQRLGPHRGDHRRRDWRADNMRQYFEASERCQYVADGAAGHGFNGWLSTRTSTSATLVIGDGKLEGTRPGFRSECRRGFLGTLGELLDILQAYLNDPSPRARSDRGQSQHPARDRWAKRNGPREYILQTVAQRAPARGAYARARDAR